MKLFSRLRMDALALTLSVLALLVALGGNTLVTEASQLMSRFSNVTVIGHSSAVAALDVDDRVAGGNIMVVKAIRTPRIWVSSAGILHSYGAIVAPAVYTQTPTPTNTPTRTPTPTNTPVPPTATP
jgi:hypothetical protein